VPVNLSKILILPSQSGYKKKLDALRRKKTAGLSGCDSDETKIVSEIIRNCLERGDKAVAEYTLRFDKVLLRPEEFRIPLPDLKKAYREIERNSPELLRSIRRAIENVKKYQSEIFCGKNKTCSGSTGIRYVPIKRVGICVPGAAAPLPSTVIMTAVPALAAGVKAENIVVVSPPRFNPPQKWRAGKKQSDKGTIHPATLATCYQLGITEVYRIGGAQAVAAMAIGNGVIPKVDKIVGPGNKWVETAKKIVSWDYVGIESIAGPSEVLIIANGQADPAFIAADMLSQAEHAKDSSAITLTTSGKLASDIITELQKQLENISRKDDAAKSLLELGAVAVIGNMDKLIGFANELASEHLEIQCGKSSRKIAERIENAGAIFIGSFSPVAVGDYWAGPSHTLPTEARAKFLSALSSNDFVKSMSIIEYDKRKLAKDAADIIRLAETEGLDAHAKSIKIRQNK
jgi:histidinol dehydrogenase